MEKTGAIASSGGIQITETEHRTAELPLLSVLPQIHSLVMSCADLRSYGFTKSQLIIFAALAHSGRLRMTQVAVILSSSKEQATRTVAQLVDDGYVAREQGMDNRRMVYVRLTDKGQELLDRWCVEFRRRLAARLDARLAPGEQEELAQSLHSLLALLDKVV